MADNLDRVSKELRNIISQAKEASERMKELESQLRRTLSSAAESRGGRPSYGRIEDITQGLLGGAISPTARVRTGGGGRIDLSKYEQEINKIITEYNRQIFEINLSQLRQELVTNLPKITKPTVPQEYINKSIQEYINKSIRQNAQLLLPARTATAFPGGVVRLIGEVEGETEKGIFEGQYKTLLDKMNSGVKKRVDDAIHAMAIEENEARPKIQKAIELATEATLNHWKKLLGITPLVTETPGAQGGLPGTFPPGFKEPTPESYTQFPKGQFSNQQFFGGVLPKIGISSDAINQVALAMKGLGVEYDRIGYSVKNYSDGTIRLVTNLKNEEGTLGSLTFRIKDNTVALQSMNKAQEQVNYTALQGQQRYKQAFALAQQQGFAPETLTKVSKFDASSGYERLTYQYKDLNGVMNTLPITIDKWGRAIVSTQKQFRTSTDAIIRDIREVARWSIAVSVIYLPMRKLSELITLAIDNEAKLADVAVRLGGAQRDLNEVFGEAAAAAQASGESLNGVLEGYALAYQAAGSFTDQTERTAVANKLLADSLILSKLSSLEQAEGLDILAGTLRQVGKSLDENNEPLLNGTLLLDKWVATVNKANVDLGTLATAFSITSESAENAGVSIDQLNGITAALSEKIGALGARETGNAVRAIIGGVYTQNAAEALQTFGISVTDTSGKMRDFLDIMTEIYTLNQKGLISEDQLNKLAYTLGGGVRRGQQYLAFLSDIDRVNELAAVSAGANGDAQAALSIKLDTVQTASTRLGNAFQTLAQSIGTSGGVLDTTKLLLDTGTSLLSVFTKLIDVMGKASTTLAVSGLAYGLLFAGKPGSTQKFGLGVGDFFQNLFAGSRLLQGGRGQLIGQTQNLSGYYERASYGQRLGSVAGPFMQKNALGFATGIPGAIGGLAQGNIASTGASIGGAVVGTLLAAGDPIGGLIGSIIAQTFVEKVQESKGTLDDLLTPPYVEGKTPTGEKPLAAYLKEGISPEETQRIVLESYARGFGGGADFNAGAFTDAQKRALKISRDRGGLDRELKPDLSSYQQAEVAARDLIQFFEKNKGQRIFSKEDYTAAKAYVDAIEAYRQQVKDKIKPEDIALETTRLFGVSTDVGLGNIETLQKLSDEYNEKLRQRLFKREISPPQYLKATTQTLGFPANLPQLFVALNAQMANLGKNTKVTYEEFDRLAKIMIEATPEEIGFIQSKADEVFQLEEKLRTLKPGTDEYIKTLEEFTTTVENLGNAMQGLGQELEFRAIKLPSTIGLEGLDPQELTKVLSKAKQLQADYYTDLQKEQERIGIEPITDAQIELAKERAEPLFVYLGELFGYSLIEGITNPEFINKAKEALEKIGTISTEGAGGFGYQFADFTAQQFQSIMGQYAAIRGSILAGGGESKEEGLLTFFKDSASPVYMEKDWKIVQFLLSQIAENTEKTVDGIFNLPEGASFYFPAQLWERFGGGGGGRGGGLPPTAGGGPTSTIEEYRKDAEKERLENIRERDKRLEGQEKK